jgi:DNA adenine methylase
MTNNLIKSPLNYIGGKFKLLPQILPLFPKEINNFIDLFAGGANVSINVNAERYIINDIESKVIELYKYIYENDLDEMIQDIRTYIDTYQLDRENKDGYISFRSDYNTSLKKHPLHFYTLICHAFSNQIRFNSKGYFNIPFGKRTFNDKMKSNFIEFVTELKKKNVQFTSDDFNKINIHKLTSNEFVYCDPPYLITTAAYNENGGWTEKDEKEMLYLLDYLNVHKIKFALSNVLHNKGKSNDILIEWSKKYNVHYLNHTYATCNYQAKDKSKDSTVEVLITNY